MKGIIIIILVGILSLTGCKETHCPAFLDQLLDYYPYTENDIIAFTNPSNDTLFMRVISNWKSDAYSFAWNCKCSCGADAGFETEMITSHPLKIIGNIDISVDTKISVITCSIYNGVHSNDNFEYQVDDVNPYLDENDNLFGDTLFFEKDEYYEYNKVLIVKGKGIVEFWENTRDCTWTIIE